jgi:hypothetical protein
MRKLVSSAKSPRYWIVVAVIVAMLAILGRVHLLDADLFAGAHEAPAGPSKPLPSGTVYPNAGWIPYKKGPFVTTVAAMYGSNPLTSCRLPGGLNGSCLTFNSAEIIDNLWRADPNTFDTMQMVLGGSEYYKAMYRKGAISSNPYFESTRDDPNYAVICDPSGYPAVCDRGVIHIPSGAVPETADDHHLFVRDHATGMDWQNWVSPIPGADPFKPYTANSQLGAQSEGLGFGGTAGNIATSWSVRPQDILAGRIPHALMIRATCDTTIDAKQGSYVYPVMPGRAGNSATDNHYFCGTPEANSSAHEQWRANTGSIVNLTYGAHLWSDVPFSDLPKPAQDGSNGCDRIAYAELRALNEFGAYVTDVGSAKYFHGPIYVEHAADINDTYTGNPYGTHSFWQDILRPLTGRGANSTLYYSLKACGVDLSSHLHVLIPPKPN